MDLTRTIFDILLYFPILSIGMVCVVSLQISLLGVFACHILSESAAVKT